MRASRGVMPPVPSRLAAPQAAPPPQTEQEQIDTQLARMVQRAIAGSVGASSHAGQHTAMKHWVTFCTSVKRTHPVRGRAADLLTGMQTWQEQLDDEWLLMEFATTMEKRVSAESAAQYTSLVKTWHEIHARVRMGPATGCVSLRRAITGMKKLESVKPDKAKLPILLEHIERWIPLIKSAAADDRMFKAASETGFQGLLRKSEYTHNKQKNKEWSPVLNLTRADLSFIPDIEHPVRAEIMLPPTKTDQLGTAMVPIILPFTQGVPMNACASLRAMVLQDPVPERLQGETPLFKWHSSGKPLEGRELLKWVQDMMGRIGECPTLYGTHSLRIGGATSLSDAGCPDHIIKTIGRWSSDCYRKYCRAALRSATQWVLSLGDHRVEAVGKKRRPLVQGLRTHQRQLV